MAPHSSTLAWKIPWMEEPGRLQSMGSLIVRHDWATSLSLSTFMHWRRKWQPTPVFLPGESHGWRSLVGCSPWVTQSRTRLKRLSSSSSSSSSAYLVISCWFRIFAHNVPQPLNVLLQLCTPKKQQGKNSVSAVNYSGNMLPTPVFSTILKSS